MGSDEEPSEPNAEVDRRADEAGAAHEGAVLWPVPHHGCPARDERERLDKHEGPFAVLNDGPHHGVQLFDFAVSMENRGRDQVKEANRHQQQQRAGGQYSPIQRGQLCECFHILGWGRHLPLLFASIYRPNRAGRKKK